MKQLFGKFACLMLLVMACCVVAPVSAMAGTGVDNFKITSGIDTRKSSEITFDATRVISGTAEKGAKIGITVYEPYTVNGKTYYKLIRTYNITVGSTGIFSQSISLKRVQITWLLLLVRTESIQKLEQQLIAKTRCLNLFYLRI